MERIVYVIQPFSRAENGALVWDAPAWSQDRDFAVTLSRQLSHRKAGILSAGAVLGASGELAPEAAIIGGYGRIPTSLILSRAGCAGDEIAGMVRCDL